MLGRITVVSVPSAWQTAYSSHPAMKCKSFPEAQNQMQQSQPHALPSSIFHHTSSPRVRSSFGTAHAAPDQQAWDLKGADALAAQVWAAHLD